MKGELLCYLPSHQLRAYYEIIKEIKFHMENEKNQIKAHRYAIEAMKKSIERYEEKIKELENAEDNQ